ncbi:MAG: MFS transporter [Planctomycetes bacterium]|nr:MFS transporter [Planctomycetota bacterium]MBI3845726.1 MFS transporter [Planctomycetota bacterium]
MGVDGGGKRAINMAVLVAALGYFVDIYDLILFSVVRVKSLTSIGVTADRTLDVGASLLNMQMTGMLIGGILWGVLGDKRGRLSVLFGSIVLYSLANIANGFVHDVSTYGWLRLVAGIGLAGELGAGITLVSEIMHRDRRGFGTTIVATVGMIGAVVAWLVSENWDWREAYFIGGGLGLALLVLRIGVYESGMFEQVKASAVSRGNFLSLFTSWSRARKYVSVVLIGIPIWFVVGILITFSPEFGKAMGMAEAPTGGRAVLFAYIGLAIGDLVSGAASQFFRNRRRIVFTFLALTSACVTLYFLFGNRSLFVFYAICMALGFGAGYWAVFVTVASEQFGTNIRATATTTAPNFVRGSVNLLTTAYLWGKPSLGVVGSGIAVGVVTLAIAFIALAGLEETYGKDLDFVEH